MQQPFPPLSSAQFAVTLATITAATLLIFGPSRIVLTALFLVALLDHPFRSHAIIHAAGIEWHPRELLLLALFAHGAVACMRRRFWLEWTPIHFGMLLYTAVFAYAAWRGLWLGHTPGDIIAESRAPLFLGAFWIFAGTVRDPRDLAYYRYLALCALVLMAAATIAAFGWFALHGPIPNTQNAFGEFVPRLIQGLPLQSIRPAGHAWLEAGLVVVLSMLMCPREPGLRKAIYVPLALLFAAAIATGMMRTAIISVGVSLAVLCWLNLPRAGRGLALALGMGLIAVAAPMALLQPDRLPGAPIETDRSLTARAVESAGALEAIRQRPFFGAGLGSGFEALGLAQKDSASSAIPEEYRSLHNAWLYIAWKSGLAGLGIALLALGIILLHSQQIINRLPAMNERCLGRGLQAALAGQLVASAAMPRLTWSSGALFLSIWATAFLLLERRVEK
ncbi:MAG: O-antigen ligase family protein [Candidatus Hydrogenedentes bacterium]|nr:O-antigen ligase family protein [Candidatus Hydrogenedentota bacterium]